MTTTTDQLSLTIVLASGAMCKLRATTSTSLGGTAVLSEKAVPQGAAWRPHTAEDRDALVRILQSIDYSPKWSDITLEANLADGSTYRVSMTRQLNDNAKSVVARMEAENMARRLGLSVDAIKVTIEANRERG